MRFCDQAEKFTDQPADIRDVLKRLHAAQGQLEHMFPVDLHDCGAVPGAVFQAALLSGRCLAEKKRQRRA